MDELFIAAFAGLAGAGAFEVVGVVGDVHHSGLDVDAPAGRST